MPPWPEEEGTDMFAERHSTRPNRVVAQTYELEHLHRSSNLDTPPKATVTIDAFSHFDIWVNDRQVNIIYFSGGTIRMDLYRWADVSPYHQWDVVKRWANAVVKKPRPRRVIRDLKKEWDILFNLFPS